MAEENITSPDSPVVATPAASPPIEVAPLETVAPVTPKSPAEVKTEEAQNVAKPETLLGSEKKEPEKFTEEKPEEKPTEEKPVEEAPKEEKPVELPTYEPFVLPESFVAEEAKMGEFTKTLAEFENTTKASHEEVQKLGQQLVNRHIDEMQRYTESLTQAWNKQKNDWKDSFLKDPEFANRSDTVVNAAIDAIGIYGGDTKQQEEFRGLMESSGVGNHPAMIRLLSNIMLAKAEPKPLAAPQISSSARVSKVEKMYGKKSA